MRFILVILGIALLAVVGLFVYGQMLQPDTRQIEQEAVRSGDA